MCKIFSTRRSSKYVYIHLEDEEQELYGARKIKVEDFEYAKKFQNNSFLAAVSLSTSLKDETDSMSAIPFRDEDVVYSKMYWLN